MFEDKSARSILLSPENNVSFIETIHAKNEIILSAGAFHSPQILKLSGIGPEQELKRHRIELVHDSPNVGMNLYDHLNLPLYVTVNEAMSITRNKVLSFKEVQEYLLYGKGVFSNFGVIGYLNDVSNDHGIGIFGAGTIDEKLLRKIVNYKMEVIRNNSLGINSKMFQFVHSQVFRESFPHYQNGSQEGFVILSTCNQPSSRGYVKLRSKLVADLPIVNPNYLHNSEDVACMIRSLRLAVELMNTEYFQQVGAKIWWPKFNECRNFEPSKLDIQTNYPTDRYLECIIRMTAVTAHHPGGTCAIGTHVDDVLDTRMHVRGVENLRVIDASVLPTPISGTPHTILVALAKYSADLILNDYIANTRK